MAFISPPTQATGDLITAARWNNNFAWLVDSGWISFTVACSGYASGWSSASGPASGSVAGLRITGNVVRLGGIITGGSSGSTPFTVGTAYRPAYTVRMTGITTASANSAVLMQVAPTGIATIAYSSGTNPVLDGLTYTID